MATAASATTCTASLTTPGPFPPPQVPTAENFWLSVQISGLGRGEDELKIDTTRGLLLCVQCENIPRVQDLLKAAKLEAETSWEHTFRYMFMGGGPKCCRTACKGEPYDEKKYRLGFHGAVKGHDREAHGELDTEQFLLGRHSDSANEGDDETSEKGAAE